MHAFIAVFLATPGNIPLLAVHSGEPSMLDEPAFRFALAVIAGALVGVGILICWAQMGRIPSLVKWGSLAAGLLTVSLTALLI